MASVEELRGLTVMELRSELKRYQLKSSGRKLDLIARLEEHLRETQPLDAVSEEDEGDDSGVENVETQENEESADESNEDVNFMPGWKDQETRHLRLPPKAYKPANELKAFYGPESEAWRDAETRHIRTVGSKASYTSDGPAVPNVVDRFAFTIVVITIIYMLMFDCGHGHSTTA